MACVVAELQDNEKSPEQSHFEALASDCRFTVSKRYSRPPCHGINMDQKEPTRTNMDKELKMN